jgi:hypothetical protein
MKVRGPNSLDQCSSDNVPGTVLSSIFLSSSVGM